MDATVDDLIQQAVADSRYLAHIDILEDRSLLIELGEPAGRLAGETLRLERRMQVGGIVWLCSGGSLPPQYHPVACR